MKNTNSPINVGIDPGTEGACFYINFKNTDGEGVPTRRLWSMKQEDQSWKSIIEELGHTLGRRHAVVALEAPRYVAGQRGIITNLTNYGKLLAYLEVNLKSYELLTVPPANWYKKLGLKSDPKKNKKESIEFIKKTDIVSYHLVSKKAEEVSKTKKPLTLTSMHDCFDSICLAWYGYKYGKVRGRK